MHVSVRHEFARVFIINRELASTQTGTCGFDVYTKCVREATLRSKQGHEHRFWPNNHPSPA